MNKGFQSRENFATGPQEQKLRNTNQQFRNKPTSAININRKDDEEMRRQLDSETQKVVHLEKLLERSIKELKRYQDRFGHCFDSKELDDDSQQDDYNYNPNLRKQFSFDSLEPIFLSYEDYINELSQLVRIQGKEIQDLETRASKYVDENHALRKELEKKLKAILNIYKNGDPNENVANLHTRILQDKLKDQVQQLSEENKQLLIQYREIEGKRKEKDATVVQAQQELRQKILEGEKINEEKMQIIKLKQTLEQRNNVLQEEHGKLLSKLTKSSTLVNQLEQQNKKLDHDLKVYKEKCHSIQNEFDENNRKLLSQISQLESEKRKLEQNYKELQLDYQNNEKQMQSNDEEFNSLNQQYQLKEQELIQAQRLNEEDAMKLKQASIKEESMLKNYQTLQEQQQKAILELDQTKIEMESLSSRLKNINKKTEEEINYIRQSSDNQVENVRSKARALLEEKDEEIDNLLQKTGQQEQDLEKIQKENKIFKDQIKDLEIKIKNDRYRNDSQNSYNKQKIEELEDQIERREKYHEDKITGLVLDKQSLENQVKNQQTLVADLKKSSEQNRKRITQMEHLNFELREKLSHLQRDRNLSPDKQQNLQVSFSKEP